MPCYMQGFFLHKIYIYHKISLGDEMKKISFAALLTSFIISLSFIVGSTIENYGSIRYLVDSNHFVGNFIDFLVHFLVWYFILSNSLQKRKIGYLPRWNLPNCLLLLFQKSNGIHIKWCRECIKS